MIEENRKLCTLALKLTVQSQSDWKTDTKGLVFPANLKLYLIPLCMNHHIIIIKHAVETMGLN